jgi:hypothetical protein
MKAVLMIFIKIIKTAFIGIDKHVFLYILISNYKVVDICIFIV